MHMQDMLTTANAAKNFCQCRRANVVKLKPKNSNINGVASMNSKLD